MPKNSFRSTARVVHFTHVCFIVVMYGSPLLVPLLFFTFVFVKLLMRLNLWVRVYMWLLAILLHCVCAPTF
jgi:hypothetical protein